MSGIDNVDYDYPYDRPMNPKAQEATQEQSDAYRAALAKRGIGNTVTTEEVNNWIEVQQSQPNLPQIKHSPLPKPKENELVEQSA